MNSDLFKRVAYASKTKITQNGFDVRSGHIHEIIAGLLGYRSKAACIADTTRSVISETGMPIVVLLDMSRARDRVIGLLPRFSGRGTLHLDEKRIQDHAAYAIARDVSECLEAESASGHIFLPPIAPQDNAALKALGRKVALANPALAGVIDDPGARYRDAINKGYSQDMAGLVARHLGPVNFILGSCGVLHDRLDIKLSGEYFPAEGEGGIVRVYIEGEPLALNTYLIDKVRAEFSEGEYFEDIPEFGAYVSEVSYL